jgi:tripartite-type tricarboxylate transporter receptor subunit TctC
MCCSTISEAPFWGWWRGGKLGALGVTTAKRRSLVPDIPAIAETVPGYEINVWYGILAPRDTPSEIVTMLNAAVNRVLADPKILARFAEDGGIPMTMSLGEFAKFLADDRAKWHDIAEFAGVKSE